MRVAAAERREDNPGPERRSLHRLPVQVRAKHELEGKEPRAPLVNLVDSPGGERLPRLRRGRGSRRAERKKERGLHRQGHNNFLANFFAGRMENLVIAPRDICDLGRLRT